MRFVAELQVSEASASTRPSAMSHVVQRNIGLCATSRRACSAQALSCRKSKLRNLRSWCSFTARFPNVQASDQALACALQNPQPEILPLLTPKQLAEAMRSFAKQGRKPADDLMNVIALEVQGKLEHFKSRDLSNTVWALAVLKYKPNDEWWLIFDRQVYNNTTDFSAQELTNLMWALAVLDHRPYWILDTILVHAVDCLPKCSASSLHIIIWALGKLGHCPDPEWMKCFLRAAQTSFFKFTPSEMSNIIWALVKLGQKLPAMWVDNFLMVAQWRFPSFNAKLLAIIVWSAAMLDHRPSQEWMLGFEEQVRDKFEEFSGQELACIAWALRKFGYGAEHNTVFYMLSQQDRFLPVDFDVMSNPKLLGQVLSWQANNGASEGSGPSSAPMP